MTKIPVLTSREVIKGLKRAGFEFDRQAKGSHEIWYKPDTRRKTTIPKLLRDKLESANAIKISLDPPILDVRDWQADNFIPLLLKTFRPPLIQAITSISV